MYNLNYFQIGRRRSRPYSQCRTHYIRNLLQKIKSISNINFVNIIVLHTINNKDLKLLPKQSQTHYQNNKYE